MNHTNLSKFLSLILRHQPEAIGVTLEPEGWLEIETLLAQMQKHGRAVTQDQLDTVVCTNDKKRFAYNQAGTHIRANQGHSVEVDLKFEPLAPPPRLFHGTASRFLESILKEGLHPQSRLHVHLSADEATAVKVGVRHGKLVILKIDTAGMADAGHEFYRSANGVWLTQKVPPAFIRD